MAVPRFTRWLLLAVLSVPVGWAGAQTSSVSQVANYPIDAAACAAMSHGGTNVVVIHPRAIGGVGADMGKTRITGYIMPDTPIFRFYALHADQLLHNFKSFAPAMHCVYQRPGTLDDISFPNLPNGKYIILVRDDTDIKYQVETGTGMAVDSLGGIVDVPFEKENREVSGMTIDFSHASVTDGKLMIERFIRVVNRVVRQ